MATERASKSLLMSLWVRETTIGTNLAKHHNHAWELCHKLSGDPEFQKELGYGKYARYAVGWTGPQLYAVLRAVDRWASLYDPEAKSALLQAENNNDKNEEKKEALQRVLDIAGSTKFPVEQDISGDYGSTQKLGCWASCLTTSDIYGVLWLARGMGVRQRNAEVGIMRFHPRALMCVQPLLDLVHCKESKYTVAGEEIPFSDRKPDKTNNDTSIQS